MSDGFVSVSAETMLMLEIANTNAVNEIMMVASTIGNEWDSKGREKGSFSAESSRSCLTLVATHALIRKSDWR